MLPIIARFFQMYTIFVLITAKFGMQQKKSARKLVKVVKNLYFCNKFYALLSVNISMTTSSSYLWSDYLHSIILRITQMNAELHVSLSNGHAIGKGSSNYRKFNENSIILDTSFCKGVSPLYTPKQTEQKWFLMRASYGQEQKACDYLQEKGIEAFCPKWKQERTYGNKKVIVEVSMIPNTLFVHSTENEMRCYIGKSPLTFFHHYYCKDINSPRCRKPITVPDSQMHAFMLWVRTDSADKIYNKDGIFNFKKGDLVRVTAGDFAGFTGYVLRYKGQTRVGISIDNIGTIFTAYIPKSLLVKISN